MIPIKRESDDSLSFKEPFYQKKHNKHLQLLPHHHRYHPHHYYRKENHSQPRRKFKTREQALAFYDELKRTNPKLQLDGKSRNDLKQLSEWLNNLMDYIEYYLKEEDQQELSALHLKIEKKKQEMIQNYCKIVDNYYYGNVYKLKIEDLESSETDLKFYLKISHKSREDQLLIILEHFKCIFNQFFIVTNDLQLYKYLDLSIKYGNIYENVKYLVYEHSDFKTKVLNYFICRECRTNYNNFQKYKQLKIKIILSYINSIINRFGTRKDYVINYLIYLKQCVKYFQSFGHLKNLNKYQHIMPKIIKLILTRNTHKFKYHCKLHYAEILNTLGQYDSSMLEQSLFLDHSVHPMQIYKYIETQNEILLLDVDQFIQIMFDKIMQKKKPLPTKKYYHYILYKFGYYNNDLFIDKYNEIQTILKQYISHQVSNIILSQEFDFPFLKHLLSKLNIEIISKSDPNWKTNLINLHQLLLSNAYKIDSLP